MAKTLWEQKDAVLALLDRGSWKHSWHLPKDDYGYVNWSDPKVREKVEQQVKQAQDEAVGLLMLARSIEL